MDSFTASETAFKNGYLEGYQKGVQDQAQKAAKDGPFGTTIREYIEKYAKGILPGQTVWTLAADPVFIPCPECNGSGHVQAVFKGSPRSFRCPICEGRKETITPHFNIVEGKVLSFSLHLAVQEEGVSLGRETVFIKISGAKHSVDVGHVFLSLEEAIEEKKRREAPDPGDQNGPAC